MNGLFCVANLSDDHFSCIHYQYNTSAVLTLSNIMQLYLITEYNFNLEMEFGKRNLEEGIWENEMKGSEVYVSELQRQSVSVVKIIYALLQTAVWYGTMRYRLSL